MEVAQTKKKRGITATSISSKFNKKLALVDKMVGRIFLHGLQKQN
jgi:hypothetical protein